MNRYGCEPRGDVCMVHHSPLACRHGCVHVDGHTCKDQDERLLRATEELLSSVVIPYAERTNWRVIEAQEAVEQIKRRPAVPSGVDK